MKKAKQILAILACVLLIGLYAFSLFLAIVGDSNSKNLFLTSIYATVIIPIIIWIYTFIYKFFKSRYQENKDALNPNEKDSEEK